MMTREEILEIDRYCQEHKTSYRHRLEELGIRFWNFYKAKKKYRLQDEASLNPAGEFVQIAPGTFSSGMMPVRSNQVRKSSSTTCQTQESFLTVELRTPTGTSMRIQGNMTASHLRELMASCNV